MFLKSRRNQENNNSNSNNSQYGGGLVPEENEDEIDCSMFVNLDELPPFCQENQTATDQGSSATGDTGPDSQAPPPPQGGSASTTVTEGGTMFTDSTIQLPLSLGIYLFENMTEQRSGELMSFVVQVTSTLLDRYTPFDVFAPSPDDSLLLVEMEGGEGKYDDNDADENYEESGSKLLATLYFSSVAASDSPLWDSWLHVSIDYTAVWPNGGSVVQQSELDQIEEASRQVLNMTVDALKFWDELLEQDQYEEYVVRLGETWNQSGTYGDDV